MLTVRIREFERGLLFRHGDLQRVLMPGQYRLWRRLIRPTAYRLERIDALNPRFDHKLFDVLLKHDDLRDALKIVELADYERGLLVIDGRVAAVIGAGRHAFWRGPRQIDVEVFDIRDVRFEHAKLDAILKLPGAQAHLSGVRVQPHEEVLVYRNGELIERIGEGRHVYWTGAGDVAWKAIDKREQVLDVAGQEIMTHDKVTLRVNLVLVFQVIDALKSVATVNDAPQALYREAQLALRAAIGARNLDTLLADKETVGNEVREMVRGRAAEFGIAVKSVGLRDIILPGEMKEILNQVIQAEKQAQANLIKRREETAAARSQANTAKLLAENPALARIKELEALQEILANTRSTFVFGGGDLASQVRSLIQEDAGRQ